MLTTFDDANKEVINKTVFLYNLFFADFMSIH